MKKIICATLASLSLVSIQAHAEALICPFTDYFTIMAPAEYAISALFSDGNITTKTTDPLNFVTTCKEVKSPRSGRAYLTVSDNANNLCTLHIKDGPYEMNPTIYFVSCIGQLTYTGVEHIWGTYTYKLKFADNALIH